MRKYFLIFISFCILQQTYAMERENKTTWTLRTLYATVANYLPTFSFSSFITRYIRKQNIQQEQKQEGTKRTFLSFFTKFFSNFTINIYKKDIPSPKAPVQNYALNRDLFDAIKAERSIFFDDSNVDVKIEDLLQQGANVNALNEKGESPLFLAVQLKKENAIKSLIKYKADVTQGNGSDGSGDSPLSYVLEKENSKAPNRVTLLYKNATSLTNIDRYGSSVFHHLISTKGILLKKHISAIIKYTQDAYEEEDLQSRRRFVEAYKSLRRINNVLLPSEVRCLILSRLPEIHFLDSDFKEKIDMLNLLLNADAQSFKILYRVMNQMVRIEKALMHKNKFGESPLQYLYEDYDCSTDNQNPRLAAWAKAHINAVEGFFDINKPRKDFIKFLEAFPDPVQEKDDNWADMAYRYLLEKK